MMQTERETYKADTGYAAEWENCSVTTRRVVERNQITRRWDCQEHKMASGQTLSVKRAGPVRVKSSFISLNKPDSLDYLLLEIIQILQSCNAGGLVWSVPVNLAHHIKIRGKGR